MTSSRALTLTESGGAGARTIIFLHGGGVGGWMWRPVVARLPEYHCLAPDLPSHGASRDIGPFTIANAAERVAEIIRHRAHDGRGTIVGLSLGAQVAVQLLATASDVVENAVISSALLHSLPAMSWANRPSVWRWTHRVFVRPLAWSNAWIRLNMRRTAAVPDEMFDEFAREFRALSEAAFAAVMLENQRYRMPRGLDRAKAPTLVLTGAREYAVMQRSACELVAALPNATGAWVDLGRGASMAMEHNWALARPEMFARAVRAWIESRPLPDCLATWAT